MELDEQEKLLEQLAPKKAVRKRKKHIKPIPRKKWCQNCLKRRVKFHHYYCEPCWQELHGGKKPEIEEEDIQF